MVPASITVVESIPLSPNGKIDRRALPEPAAEAAVWAPPVTPVERGLAAIWGEVLDMSRVGLHDDFFALGGFSLLATQVVARVRAAFGVDLSLRRLFEAPTVASLAVEIVRAQLDGPAGTESARGPGADRRPTARPGQ
jgi:hypothetical protein